MRCLLAQKQMERTAWPRILQEVSFIHNAQPNASFSPNEIMYGTRLRTNIDTAIPLTEPYDDCPDIDSYYGRATQDNKDTHNRVSENIERAQH